MIRDRWRRSRLHLSGLPVGQVVDRRGMGAKEVLGWDGTGCLESVGGCGSGLVLNGQECWRGTGVVGVCVEVVVWEWEGDGQE